MRTIGTLIFPGFELLDAFGPLELFGALPNEFRISLVAERDEPVASGQAPRAMPDTTFAASPQFDILLVPGGPATREEVTNQALLKFLRKQSAGTEITASVCTGAALLAAAGLLDGLSATTNKMAWAWATSFGHNVAWRSHARWVEDGKVFTSSGVTAGMDMCLALIARLLGEEAADHATVYTEYRRQKDPSDDPFAALYGL